MQPVRRPQPQNRVTSLGIANGSLCALSSILEQRLHERLLHLGLNHAVLLDMIANPPVTGSDGGAW